MALTAVGYHMLHDRFSRQMQVLVDGRSVYEPTVGGVPWTDLALTIDDIERIEVIRGPNAASYGSNSFTAVINIITRHPVLDRGVSLKANAGSNGLAEGFLRYGGNHRSFDYHINYTHQEIDGTDNTSKGQYSIAGPSDNLNLLASHDFDRGYTASVGFCYLSKMKQLETNDIMGEQKRLDLRIARTLSAARHERTFALVIQNWFDDEQETRLKNNIDRRIYASFAINYR